jgi:penicillin V acylase-like amidase (Ntn superfamily)
MKRNAFVVVMVLLLFAFDRSYGCTTLFTIDETGPRVGFNLDYSNYHPKVWVVPASEGRYGRFCFGFDENYRIAEGGMNEKGLFIAVNALNSVK